ncbi:hypothetical protein ABMA28_000945 [Loxostege sticticalis]|uniref:Uncharacterized protein n=1 Tax=Loxostege sticticalis TaxID=481309 RepID=A0ABD0T850_LOXSC
MNSITIFLVTTYFILAVSHASPIETKKKNVLDEKEVIYTGEHEIVKIYTSLALMEELEVQRRLVFFIDADINNDGSKVDKGLYVIIDNSTTKLLNNGKDIAGDATGKVFFATNDGVYAFNPKERKAYKYGHMEEKIISLAVENNTGVIYALTENHIMYKITENGNKSEVDDRVQHAREIIIDMLDNLYYFDEQKNLYVVVDHDAKKIDGLPKNPTSITMIKPPIGVEGIFLIADDVPYIVYSNGTTIKSEDAKLHRTKSTAYSFDAMIVLYFGHEKKIYEYNILEKIITGIFEGLSDWVKKNLSFVTFS